MDGTLNSVWFAGEQKALFTSGRPVGSENQENVELNQLLFRDTPPPYVSKKPSERCLDSCNVAETLLLHRSDKVF